MARSQGEQGCWYHPAPWIGWGMVITTVFQAQRQASRDSLELVARSCRPTMTLFPSVSPEAIVSTPDALDGVLRA